MTPTQYRAATQGREKMKDFTPEQARRWVEQELAKATTPEKIASRIKSEKQMIAILCSMADIDAPNSEWAHNELLRRLEKAA